MWHIHYQKQAATSGVFWPDSILVCSARNKRHVMLNTPQQTHTHTRTFYNPPPPFFHLPERREVRCGRRGEKDHPHWDHSPSISPFHTLWTWNNQGLIAAVCLSRPRLKVQISSGCSGNRDAVLGWDAPEDTHSSAFSLFPSHPPLCLRVHGDVSGHIYADGHLLVILVHQIVRLLFSSFCELR